MANTVENDYDSRTALRFLERKIGRLNKRQRENWVKHIQRLIDCVNDGDDVYAAIRLADILGMVDMHIKARIGKQIEVDDEEAA